MDRNQAKEFYPIMQAFAEGKTIECRTKPSALSKSWQEIRKHEPFIKYKLIESSKDVYLIIQRIKTYGIETDVERLDFETAFKWFTFADGTPFGVKLE